MSWIIAGRHRFKQLTKSVLQRFGLADVAHAIDKILAGADREHIDVFEGFQLP